MIGITEISVKSLETMRDDVLTELALRRANETGNVYWKITRGDAWVVVARNHSHSQSSDWCYLEKQEEGSNTPDTLLILGIGSVAKAILRVQRGVKGVCKSVYGDIEIDGVEVVATTKDVLDKQFVIDECPALAGRVGSDDLPLRLALTRLGFYQKTTSIPLTVATLTKSS